MLVRALVLGPETLLPEWGKKNIGGETDKLQQQRCSITEVSGQRQ
jgi:hypothetical protein